MMEDMGTMPKIWSMADSQEAVVQDPVLEIPDGREIGHRMACAGRAGRRPH